VGAATVERCPSSWGFGWSQQLPGADPWWESMDTVDHHLVFDAV
jgi:hypothetical protein